MMTLCTATSQARCAKIPHIIQERAIATENAPQRETITSNTGPAARSGGTSGATEPPNKLPASQRRLAWIVIILAACLLAAVVRNWVTAARFRRINHTYRMIESPNQSARPSMQPINCVVLHATATKSLDETLAIFSDPAQKVSAHFVVDKDGTVVQTVPAQNRAWHAGVSRLGNETGVNDFSVGIEMVNADDGRDPYTDRQYAAVAAIIRLLRTQCAIPDNRIVTHAQIALPPGRKQDPIGFDMDRVRNEAGAASFTH